MRQYVIKFKIGVLPFKVIVVARSRSDADKMFVEQWQMLPDSIEELN